jgi:hypothetical protein
MTPEPPSTERGQPEAVDTLRDDAERLRGLLRALRADIAAQPPEPVAVGYVLVDEAWAARIDAELEPQPSPSEPA